ncbi:MAG: hypothetical protein B6D55_03295 [Candidatus Omnitrophica bacterium 4484_70.2]|nr:MAG: hypothetical protein B6D55_03295 [Candidatus Omnitrophica bacterium 4484_70.2]
MAKLSEEEKKELRELAQSSTFKMDLRRISESQYNPFIVKDKIDIDRFIIFLSEYNYFINHTLKPFRKIKDKKDKL